MPFNDTDAGKTNFADDGTLRHIADLEAQVAALKGILEAKGGKWGVDKFGVWYSLPPQDQVLLIAELTRERDAAVQQVELSRVALTRQMEGNATVAKNDCLAAAQARIVELREALGAFVHADNRDSDTLYYEALERTDKLLVLADNTDALDRALAAERERCAKLSEDSTAIGGSLVAEWIRSMK